MATKQIGGMYAPDGSSYVTIVDGAGTLSTLGSGTVTPTSQYPSGATPITASNTGTTAGVTATLAGVSAKTTYIAGFTINSAATAGTSVAANITGTITGTLNFIQPVGALTADVGVLTIPFNPAIPASAVNTGIAINSGAAGSGGLAAVTAWGYQL